MLECNKKDRPNILFFLSDQHSTKFINDCETKFINTPTINSLIKEGTTFLNAYCQNPLCVPSRASLLTGQYSKKLGIYENRHVLESNSQTLPSVLSAAGYQTCLIGKAHFNGEQYQGYQQRPYGDLYGQGHQPEYIRDGNEKCESGLEDILQNTGPTEIPLPMTQTEICVSEAVKWLQIYSDKSTDKPFFLSVNFDKPHFPYRPPAEYYNKYVNKVSLPEYPYNYANTTAVEFVKKAFQVNGAWEHYGKDKDIHERALASYCGCVEWIDNAMCRILDSLEFLGLADNTIVIYSSDHGEMAAEKGSWQKTVFFDSSSKIPLIIKWPNKIRAGIASKELTGLIDLFPTLCKFAGADIPKCCDGISLVDHLCEGIPLNRKEIFCESVVLSVPEHAGCMIRTPKFKYNYYLIGEDELYDMETDPDETKNLIGNLSYKEIEVELRERVEKFWQPAEQINRYKNCPIFTREKHFYLYSNQFISSDGTVYNGRP